MNNCSFHHSDDDRIVKRSKNVLLF